MISGLAQITFDTSNFGENLAVALVILGGWIASVCLHEFGHAIVAYGGGDISVKDKGYLTLNPVKYTDISLSLVMPIFFLAVGGMALPGAAVYINMHLLRNRIWKSAVSAAGPIATALVAVALSLPFRWGWATETWVWQALACLAYFQVMSLCFNLLPIPFFDGFGILEPWLPERIQTECRRWARYSYFAVIAILWFVPIAAQTFYQWVQQVSQAIGIPEPYAALGYGRFRGVSGVLILVVVAGLVLFRKQVWSPQMSDGSEANPPSEQEQMNMDTSTQHEAWERELAAYDHALQSGTVTASVYQGRAELLTHLQRYKEALASYDQALKHTDQHTEIHKQRAVILYRMGHYESALASYGKVINGAEAITSEDWYVYGTIQAQLDCYEDAIASYDRSLEITPDRPAAWYDRGLAYYWINDYQNALTSFDRAVYLQPDLQEAWFRRGLVLNRLQRYDRALECFNQALSISEDLPAVWAAKGLALLQMDQCEAAVMAHEKSVKLDPSDAHAWYNKACCHARLAETEQAIASLDHAVQLNPEPTREIAIEDPDFEALQTDPAFQKLIYA